MRVLKGLRRVVCGMSGGVDSTVSALLLKRKGYEVVGVFMKNWEVADETTGKCPAEKDAEEAELICKRLNIPFRTVNFVKEYWHEVFSSLISEYERGRTPNPDVLCNSRIKFNHFQRHCFEEIGCDALATGHYARTTSFDEDLEFNPSLKRVKLLKPKDRVKDQTLFLSQISQESLKRVVFPIGYLKKDVVKKIAASSGFESVAKKKESMGICFIGKRRNGFQLFIEQYIPDRPGDIVDIDTGKIIGRHNGIHQWTLGQRVPLHTVTLRQYLVERDVERNRLIVCSGNEHPALYTETFYTEAPHWIDQEPPDFSKLEFRFQNTMPVSPCVVSRESDHRLFVTSEETLRSVSPGQYATFYSGEECLGSAVIERSGPSLYDIYRLRKKAENL